MCGICLWEGLRNSRGVVQFVYKFDRKVPGCGAGETRECPFGGKNKLTKEHSGAG